MWHTTVKSLGAHKRRLLSTALAVTLGVSFLAGTLVLGDESMAVSYGSDRMRDMAGLVELIGDNRWRLVLPSPAYESLLDVIELVPAN